MPSQTPNLDLYKVNGETDGNDTFNVDVVLNDNWDKIDAAVGQIQEELGNVTVPDASLTQKGITQLSSAIDSTSEAMAATPKAVKSAYDRGSAGVTAAAAAQAKADAAETPAGAQAKANAAETNAKNASLPRSGGAMTGKLNLQTWATISGSASGYALYGSNCYLDANNKFRFENTHANLGARGFILTYGLGEGVYIFDTGPAATTAGAEFTPSLKRVLDQDDYDSLFQSVANGKQAIATAISGKGIAASGSDEFAVLANKISQIKTETPSGSVYVDFSQQDYMVWANTTQRYKIADIPAGVKMISFEYVSSVSDGIYLKVEQPMSAYVCILNVVLRDANGMEIEVLNESRSIYGGRYYPRFLLNLVTNNRTYSSLPDDIFPRPNPSMGRFDISTSGFDRSRPMVLEIKAQNPSPNDNTMRVTHMVRGTVSYA
ncbi:phage tail protein [Paenibacillus lactis]|uniref:phage tail protein n=1 Tax=Paenibacillus lactis TaxID=228574 RepID=UPI00203F3F1A|nr:phage tail protein [Paenibacillus lactis]MCM3494570.1 phage tail protein [Paenibacillus lactis]